MKYLAGIVLTLSGAFLFFSCRAPVLVLAPGQNLTVSGGELVEFSVEIIDPAEDEEKSIQWLINGKPVPGETENTFRYVAPLINSPVLTSITAEVVDKRLMGSEISSLLTVLPHPYAHIPISGDFTYTVDLGATPKDVYFIFTNTSLSEETQLPSVSADFTAREITPPESADTDRIEAPPLPRALRGTPEISAFNNNPPSFGSRTANSSRDLIYEGPAEMLYDNVGDPGSFEVYDDTNSVSATCQKTVKNVNGKTLNIWVADDWWVDTSLELAPVNQTMVNALADKFLKPGDNNDIYEWITNIFGEEWGSHEFDNLISEATAKDEITILLYDIKDNGSPVDGQGYIVGLFDSTNNFTAASQPDSNERIMFFLDAPIFADDTDNDGTWDINIDFWPNEVVSTLAHEFQHMIHFYQKQIRNNVGNTSTWLNEMSSMAAEDMVADKIKTNGPRGVNYNDGTAGEYPLTADRLARYNYYNNANLLYWPPLSAPPEETLKHYSLSYSFGAYLVRNYDGPSLFRNIVQSGFTNYQAVESALAEAVGENIDFSRALQRWGAAVLLSDRSDVAGPYRYNLGDYFTFDLEGVSYNAGSINLYNYQYTYSDPQLRGPKIYSGNSIGETSLTAASNTFYYAGGDLTGLKSWDISVPEGVKLSVVFK